MSNSERAVTILGAGLAGTIMYSVLNKKATIIEKSKPATKSHHAVLHFRNPELGRVLDLEFEKVKISKGIIYNNQFHDKSTLHFSNLYSQKLLNCITERSIDDLEEKERWITNGENSYNHVVNPDSVNTYFNTPITAIEKGKVHINNEGGMGYQEAIDSDIIISTLPLPVILSFVGEDIPYPDDVFESHEIYVYRAKFPKGFCDVYQTLYYPDSDHPVYRASIDKDEIIIEAVSECCDDTIWNVVDDFGIKDKGIDEMQFVQKIQKHGKIKPLDDETRRVMLNMLTTKYNIYSIGRFALWKNVRADDMYKDAVKIKQMIKTSEGSANYFLRKGESNGN